MIFSQRFRSRLFAAGAVLAGVLLMGAGAPSSSVPNFMPDAQTSWVPEADDFAAPPSGPGPVTFDPAHPYYPNFTPGKDPTYRVADLTNPILQSWAKERMKKDNDAVIAGKIPFRARERCFPPGVPAFAIYSLVEPLYFLQTPNKVTIIDRGNEEVRRVYLNVPHSARVTPSWYGESVGHYENGDTLVIDTIGLTEKSYIDNYRTPHTEKLHVVERYRLIDGGKRIELTMTIDDPGTFTTPWTAMQSFRMNPRDPFDERICAENATNFFNQDLTPVPQAEAADF
jgi:hypothetical protein